MRMTVTFRRVSDPAEHDGPSVQGAVPVHGARGPVGQEDVSVPAVCHRQVPASQGHWRV